MGPRGAKMEPKWRQDGVKTAKKSEKNTNATKKRVAFYRVPPRSRKSGQHGPNLGPKMEPRWPKNRCKNASFFWCLLESIFGWILVDFGYQNWDKLAPKWDQKSMLTPKGVFSKNSSFPNEKLSFFKVKWVQVESQNRPKIDQKMESKMECILASIF